MVQPPFVTLLVVLSAWLVHSLLGPWPTIIRVPVLGGVLVALGFSCMLWARILFTSRHTTLFVGRRSSQLLGLALWVGTWPFYTAAPATFLFLNVFHIPREERLLHESFGERCLAYSREVRRWL